MYKAIICYPPKNLRLKSLCRKEGSNIQISGNLFRKASQILIKEAFVPYKMCHNFKSIKSMKENVPYMCRAITFEEFALNILVK